MFDRFTDDAKRLMSHARKAALALNHDYIGTEHMLLGALAIDSVREWLESAGGVTAEDVRSAIEEHVARGTVEQSSDGQLPVTPRAKRALELTLTLTVGLRTTTILPHHVVVGLLRESDGVAGAVLRGLGVDEAKLVAALPSVPPWPGVDLDAVLSRVEWTVRELRPEIAKAAAADDQAMLLVLVQQCAKQLRAWADELVRGAGVMPIGLPGTDPPPAEVASRGDADVGPRGKFDRYDDATKHAMNNARNAAAELGHEYIGTEHILMGLLAVDPVRDAFVAATRVSADAVHAALLRIMRPGERAAHGQLPFTPRSGRVLKLAMAVASEQRATRILPHHVLVALVREHDGIAAHVLRDLGVDEAHLVAGLPPDSA